MVIFAQCYFHPFKPLNYFALSKICPKSLCFYSNNYKKVNNSKDVEDTNTAAVEF